MKKNSSNIFCICATLFSFFFFYKFFPITIYDSDDWAFTSLLRMPIPIWGAWNPARILPEVLMPISGYISAFFIYPFTNHYIESFTITSALLVSICIGVYLYTFTKILEKRFELPALQTSLITAIFFLLHFCILRSNATDNSYLFLCRDLSCYYFYLIPNLLCFSIVFLSIAHNRDDIRSYSKNNFVKIIFWILLYFTIFSNLYASITLLSYAVFLVLFDFFSKNQKKSTIQVIKNHSGSIAILFFWIISAIFEKYGGRGQMLEKSSLTDSYLTTLKYFISTLNQDVNKIIFLLGIIAIIGTTLKTLRQADTKAIKIKCFTFCFLLTGFYLFSLSAFVDPAYIQRSDTMFPAYVFFIALIVIGLAIIIKQSKKWNILISILFCFMTVFTLNFDENTFKESNYSNSKKSAMISEKYVQEIIKESRTEKDTIYLKVLRFSTEDNWPHPEYMGNHIERALYRHKLIKKHLHIKIKPELKDL